MVVIGHLDLVNPTVRLEHRVEDLLRLHGVMLGRVQDVYGVILLQQRFE
jgi:hypothetical protein